MSNEWRLRAVRIGFVGGVNMKDEIEVRGVDWRIILKCSALWVG